MRTNGRHPFSFPVQMAQMTIGNALNFSGDTFFVIRSCCCSRLVLPSSSVLKEKVFAQKLAILLSHVRFTSEMSKAKGIVRSFLHLTLNKFPLRLLPNGVCLCARVMRRQNVPTRMCSNSWYLWFVCCEWIWNEIWNGMCVCVWAGCVAQHIQSLNLCCRSYEPYNDTTGVHSKWANNMLNTFYWSSKRANVRHNYVWNGPDSDRYIFSAGCEATYAKNGKFNGTEADRVRVSHASVHWRPESMLLIRNEKCFWTSEIVSIYLMTSHQIYSWQRASPIVSTQFNLNI